MIVEPLINEEEWEDFVAKSPQATFFHTLKWKRVLEECLALETQYLTIRDLTGNLVGICPFVALKELWFFKALNSLPDSDFAGPLVEAEHGKEALSALKSYLRELSLAKSITYASIRCPAASCEGLRENDSKVDTSLGTMNLYLTDEKTADFIWHRVFTNKGGQRKFIRRCEREGFQNIEMQSKQDLARFYTLYHNGMIHIGVSPYPLSYFQSVYHLLYPENFNIMLTTDGRGKCLAAQAFFIYREKKDIYLMYLGIDRDAENRFHPSDYLHWGMIQWAQRNGFKHISLGTTPSNPSDVQYSTKSKFGATFNQDYTVYIPFNRKLFLLREYIVLLGRRVKNLLPRGL